MEKKKFKYDFGVRENHKEKGNFVCKGRISKLWGIVFSKKKDCSFN